MYNYLISLYSILSNQYVTLAIILGAWVFKVVLFFGCLLSYFTARNQRGLLLTLIIFLGGLIANDLTFILSFTIRIINQIRGDLPNYTLYCRICWAIYITQWHAIALFFEYLIHKRITWHPVTFFFHILDQYFNKLAIVLYK